MAFLPSQLLPSGYTFPFPQVPSQTSTAVSFTRTSSPPPPTPELSSSFFQALCTPGEKVGRLTWWPQSSKAAAPSGRGGKRGPPWFLLSTCLNLSRFNSICPSSYCSDWNQLSSLLDSCLLHFLLINTYFLPGTVLDCEPNMPRLLVSIRRHESKKRKTQRGCRQDSVDRKLQNIH